MRTRDGKGLSFEALLDLHELKLLAFHRYQDYRPYLALERRFVREFVGDPAPR